MMLVDIAGPELCDQVSSAHLLESLHQSNSILIVVCRYSRSGFPNNAEDEHSGYGRQPDCIQACDGHGVSFRVAFE